ncbi:MAG: hypothetical protein AAFQ75_16990 [Pseudomonadota bacterium]
MNMTPDSEQFVAPKTKTKSAKRPDWIAKNHAAAAAHNAKPIPVIGGRPFIHGDAKTIASSSAEVKAEFRELPVRLALGGCYLIFWGTAAAIAVGLYLG